MVRYERDQKFLHVENWKDIKRGWIYEAVIPYTAERPLDFFTPDADDPNRGTVAKSNGTFNPNTVQKAIFEMKQRKICIISNDDFCQDPSIYDITVAPIYGIYEDDKKETWYEETKNDTHPFYTYLSDEYTGKECVVDLSNVMTINKTMLLKDKKDVTSRLPQIEKCLGYCFSLGMYKKQESSTEDIG